MSRRMILFGALVALAGTPARAQIPISRDILPTRTALARVGLEKHWMAVIPLAATERLAEISMAPGLVFAQTDHANFHVYDSETGRLLWNTNLGRRTGDVHPASANSRLVFVTNGNHLFALDRATGRQVWVERLQFLPTSATACDEERVMVGTNTGLLRAFELRAFDDKGNVKKDEDGRPILANRAGFAWNWQTSGGPMTSRPLPAGRLVAFADRSGRAYVALSETPKMLYRIKTGGEIYAAMAGHDTRTLLIPSADRNLYAVDLFTSNVIWSFSTGAPVMQEPIVAGDDVYVANTVGVLTAVDVHSGTARWSTPTYGGRFMSVSKTRIYLESHDDDLFVVDRGTGRVVADPRSTYQRAGLDLRGYALGITNILDDRLYLATTSGVVLGLREIGQVTPSPLRGPKAPPFGYIPPEGLKTEPTPSETPPAEAPAEGDAMPKEEGAAPAEEKPAP